MKNRTLPTLFVANSISGFAQGITMLSLPWYFTHTLKNPALFGKLYGFITLISIFWILIAGTLIDRYSRKKIFMAMNLVGCIVLITIATIGFSKGGVSDIHAMICFATTIFIFNIHYPNLYTFAQEISLGKNFGRINSAIEIQGQLTNMMSGGFAAMLLAGYVFQSKYLSFNISPWKLETVLFLNGITYALSFLIISTMKYKPIQHRVIDKSRLVNRLKDGFMFLYKRPYLFLFGLGTLSIFVFTLVHEFYLLSIYIDRFLKSSVSTYALSQFLYASGALFSGLLMNRISKNIHTPLLISILIFLATLLIIGLFFIKFGFYILVFSFLLGILNAGTRILRITYMFHIVPNGIMGRVNSVLAILQTSERMFFIFLLSGVFFTIDDHIKFAYLILGGFTFFGAIVLFLIRNRLTKI